MKPDLYTKIILTVIAVALVGIFLKDSDLIPAIKAKPMETMDVNIESVDRFAFQDCKVPVEIKSPVDKPGLLNRPVQVEVTNASDFPH